MRRYFLALSIACVASSVAFGGVGKPGAGKEVLRDWREALNDAISNVRPLRLKPLSYGELDLRFDLSDTDAMEFAKSIEEIARIADRAERRRKSYHRRLSSEGKAEVPISTAAVRFELDLGEVKLKFDRFGELFIDRRFVTKEELGTIKRVEARYRRVLEKQRAEARREKKPPVRLSSREKVENVRPVPIFRGFEDERYQKHDALILRLVREFNANKALWAGATPEQAAKIPDLTPALVKAIMIEETGGSSAVSRAAWERDPLQVNVPGDWDPAKALVGLRKPQNRNEGTLAGNMRAGIKWLVRKGFGASGRPASRRKNGYFDDWRTALKRYNARPGRTADGRRYADAYADKIIRRSKNPDVFVPVELKLKK